MAIGMSTTLRDNRLDQITSAAGASALIKIYDGTRPATGGAVTTLLATLTCNATFAPASSGGTLTLNAIAANNAVATSTATWFRLTTSGGTFVLDGSVGTSGADLNLNTTSIVSGASVAVTSAVFTEGNA